MAKIETCPTCGHHIVLAKRTIHHRIAASLIAAHLKFDGSEYFHAPSLEKLPGVTDSHEFSSLAYWGLIKEAPEKRLDGGKAGWWRILDKGREFAKGDSTVTKYAEILDGDLIGFSGPEVDVFDCLKKGFDLQELSG